MSLIFGNNVNNQRNYFLATVIQVVFENIIKQGRIILQKYSIKCRVRGADDIITRRHFSSDKFISIPKKNQLVYIYRSDRGYFWTKRFDSTSKNNLRLDHNYGSTFMFGTNFDAIQFNGVDSNSRITISSNSTTDNNYAKTQFNGQEGKINIARNNAVTVVTKDYGIRSSGFIFLGRTKQFKMQGKSIDVLGSDGVTIKNDVQASKEQPMVLGDKLIQWQQDLLNQVKSFLSNYTTAVQTGINATAGPGRAGARVAFKTRADLQLGTLFKKRQTNIKNKLSPKNKVD